MWPIVQNLKYAAKLYVLTDQWITSLLLDLNNVENLPKQVENDVKFGQNCTLETLPFDIKKTTDPKSNKTNGSKFDISSKIVCFNWSMDYFFASRSK